MPGFPNNQGNPAGAIPVYVTSGSAPTFVDGSATIPAATPTEVLSANVSRRYLLIQCLTAGEDIWINLFGSDAGVGNAPSIKLTAGQTYESGPTVSNLAISIYCVNEVTVTVVEG